MFIRFRRHLVLALCMSLVATLGGCAADETAELHSLTIGETEFFVEIADSEESRRLGLMHRESLPEGRGMLFVFDRDQQLSFWMRNTSIPLSIAYISRDGIIHEIYDMEPFSLEPVRSRRSVRYALEVNRGEFERAGIEPGDRVELPQPAQ